MINKIFISKLILILALSAIGVTAQAQDNLSINTGIDLYSRYLWRGLELGSTPSLQPTVSLGFRGFEIGTWAAYSLSNSTQESDEIDFWLSYSHQIENSVSIAVVVTDYYFPDAGTDLFNFNNYDNLDESGASDPGAHTLELGLTVTGPESLPVSISGYVNVHNDAGYNSYFQIDVPFQLTEKDISLFVGATAGSNDNPDFYGSDRFQVIDIGVQVSSNVKVSGSTTVPLSVSLEVNPLTEIAYVVVGIGI